MSLTSLESVDFFLSTINSLSQAAWNSAAADCTNQLGDSATLLAIESEEEWEFLKEILENYGFGKRIHLLGNSF